MRTLTVRVEDEIEDRLTRLAKDTHRSKSFYIRQALLQSLEDLEDVYLADQVIERLRKGEEKTYSLAEVEERLGLDR